MPTYRVTFPLKAVPITIGMVEAPDTTEAIHLARAIALHGLQETLQTLFLGEDPEVEETGP